VLKESFQVKNERIEESWEERAQSWEESVEITDESRVKEELRRCLKRITQN